MRALLLAVALVSFGFGWWLGRDARRQTDSHRCPRCRQRRLFWCRGCGVHFDDEDRAIPPREYERMTATDAFFEEDRG